MGQWIRTDGARVDIYPRDGGKVFTLGELQEKVGGFIEVIRIFNENQWLIVNEDGRQLALPFNQEATSLLGIRVLGDVLLLEDEEME